MREKFEEGYDRGAFQTATNQSSRPVTSNRATPRESPRGVRRFWPAVARVYGSHVAAPVPKRGPRERRPSAHDAALPRETLTLSVPGPESKAVNHCYAVTGGGAVESGTTPHSGHRSGV